MQDEILKKESGDTNAKITVTMAGFAVPAYEDIPVLAQLEKRFGLFVCLPILIPFSRFLYFLLKEKEYKIKEYMKIMGLSESAYYVSWLTWYSIIFMFISLVVTWELKSAALKHSDFSVIFI